MTTCTVEFVPARCFAALVLAGLISTGCAFGPTCPAPVPELAVTTNADGRVLIVLPRCEGGPPLVGDNATSLEVWWSSADGGSRPSVIAIPRENRPVLIRINEQTAVDNPAVSAEPEDRRGYFVIEAMRGAEIIDVATGSLPEDGMVSVGMLRTDIPLAEYQSRITRERCDGVAPACQAAEQTSREDARTSAEGFSLADTMTWLATAFAVVVGALAAGLFVVAGGLRFAGMRSRRRHDQSG